MQDEKGVTGLAILVQDLQQAPVRAAGIEIARLPSASSPRSVSIAKPNTARIVSKASVKATLDMLSEDARSGVDRPISTKSI